MKEHLGALKGRKVVILGDILFSRVAQLATSTPSLQDGRARHPRRPRHARFPLVHRPRRESLPLDLKGALADAEVVMLLRIQHGASGQRPRSPPSARYTSMFDLNKTRASWLNSKAIIMHHGTINRGVEIDSTSSPTASAA